MTCLLQISEASLPANRSLVTVFHTAFWSFFLDHELMLGLHGAEGAFDRARTTWRDVQYDTRLSIGGTCAQLGDSRLLTISLGRWRHRHCAHVQCPPFG